jgi:hypothetical protein
MLLCSTIYTSRCGAARRLFVDTTLGERCIALAIKAAYDHPAVAPLQWRCIACVCTLLDIDSSLSDVYAARRGPQQVHTQGYCHTSQCFVSMYCSMALISET